MLDLLQNAQSNAEIQGLQLETLVVDHIQCNQAPKLRRRTYRAHGRINPYMSSPSHIELILTAKAEHVKKATDEETAVTVRSKKSKGKLQSGETGFQS